MINFSPCLLAFNLFALAAGAAQSDSEQPAVDKSVFHLFNPTPSQYLTADGQHWR